MSVTVNVTNQYITFEIVNDGPEDLKRFYTLEYFESVHMHEYVEIYIQRPEEKRMVGGRVASEVRGNMYQDPSVGKTSAHTACSCPRIRGRN